MKKQQTKSFIFITLLFSIFISGCSLYRINSQDTTLEYYPAKDSPSEVVYLEKVTKPHDVMGYVTVNAERNQRLNHVIEKMKREASILGGDAITDIKTDATGTWKKLPAQALIGNGYVRANFSANVVAYK